MPLAKLTRSRSRLAIGLAAVVAVFGVAHLYGAVTYQHLHSFTVATDGFDPGAALVEGPDGSFYGVTQNSGDVSVACGTAFRISSEGAFTLLHTFLEEEGCLPTGLLLASNGLFYGTTAFSTSGLGTVFTMTTDGTVEVLHEFSGPEGGGLLYPVIEGAPGVFYGTTLFGGDNDAGVAFRMDTEGAVTVLHHFGSEAGAGVAPSSSLLLASDGAFYGTTFGGGNPGEGTPGGTVFKMTVTGDVGDVDYLFNFAVGGGHGDTPVGGLVQTGSTTFYGTTSNSLFPSEHNTGTLFRLDEFGLGTVHSFSTEAGDLDGAFPYGRLLVATDGNLYGTTLGGGTPSGLGGTVFRYPLVTPGPLEILHVFDGSDETDPGNYPVAGLTQGTDGKVYGTTGGLPLFGGPTFQGTIFSLDLGLAPGEPGVVLTIAPPQVQGGKSATATVTIPAPASAGGVTVTLTTDTPSVATVPASVTIAAGQTSAAFKIPTVPVGSATVVQVSASVGGPSATATFLVEAPTLSKLALKPMFVVGGLASTGTVTLHGEAPAGGLAVIVTSDNAIAQVSSPVIVPAGETSVTFSITTSAAGVSTEAVISASYGGVTKTKTLTVTPVALATITSHQKP